MGEGLLPPTICKRLGIRMVTFRGVVRQVARKLPGDQPALIRINLWWRGIDRVYLYRQTPSH